jgi:hypothetical protein
MAGGQLKPLAANATFLQKKYSVRAGIGIGFIASACYLFATHASREIEGSVLPPDPVWAQFVNVALIFFAAIFTTTMLRKWLCGLPTWRKGELNRGESGDDFSSR